MNDQRSNLIKAGSMALGEAVMKPLCGASDAAAPAHASAEEAPSSPPPTISLIRDGDVVRAIEVTCPCGNTMVIECDYGEETAS